jgi:hypothetical protein
VGRGIVYIESGSVSLASTTNPSSVVGKTTESLKVSAYPNPVTDKLNIQLPENLAGSKISLVNTSGQLVFGGVLNNAYTTIDMANMPGGIYLLKIINGSQSSVTKIVKK